MLSGDFATMGLADVMQWLDATRIAGVLTIDRGTSSVWIAVADRSVTCASRPPNRPVSLAALGGEALAFDADAFASAVAVEHLYDQFLDLDGGFRFVVGAAPAGGQALDLALAELLMESLRLLDEWPAIELALPNDRVRLELAGPEPRAPSVIQRALLDCAKQKLTLNDARFALGLSRPALLRRVRELVVLGALEVHGMESSEDPAARLLGQARELLKQQQFDEAAHVFSALLTSDPSAISVRKLLRSAEQQQLEWLRGELPSHLVPIRTALSHDGKQLGASEREVLAHVNGRWDIGVVSLVSPLRETETLKSLRRLKKLRLIELAPPQA